MKKKKIINIRQSILTGALVVTTLLTGLTGCSKHSSLETPKYDEPSTSQTIIEDGYVRESRLPNGMIIDSQKTLEREEQTVELENTEIESETEVEEEIEVLDVAEEVKVETSKETETKTVTSENAINSAKVENKVNVSENEVKETAPSTESVVTNQEVKENNTSSENESIVEHTHQLGEWKSINNWLEGNFCPEDGELVRTRLHNYKITNIKTTNNDGTYNFVITSTCQSCGNVLDFTFKNIKNNINTKPNGPTNNPSVNPGHNNGNHGGGSHGGSGITKPEHTHYYGEWVSINDDLEATYCPEDGVLVATRAHKYETNTKTVSNNNGTHKTITTETCINCNHSKNPIVSENMACTFDAGIINKDQNTITYTCTECGYSKTEDYKEEHQHNWSEWTVTKAPTCTEDGEKTRTCTVAGCEIKTETEIIPALGHNYGEWTVVEDWHVVTKEDGSQVEERTLEQICSTCNDKITKTEERPYVPGHTHNWSEWTVTKEPTCTEDGEETRSCSRCDHTETREIEALGHKYTESTGLVSNNDGTHNLVKTKTCDRCDDVKTETISTSDCTYNNITEVKNDDGVVIQEIHACDCGDSYTVSITPKPEHTTHVEDDHGQYERTADDCCYETYYICKECGKEFGNNKVGHNKQTNSLGIIKCTKCGEEFGKDPDFVPPTPPTPPTPPAPPAITTAVERPEETVDKIIEDQENGIEDANTSADEKLDDLINSGADESEVDEKLDQIISDQEQEISDANAEADQKLNETIENIENKQVDQIIAEQDQTIESAKENAESLLEQVLASDADESEKDAAIDRIIEETERIIGEATAKADAELSALTGTVENPMVRELIK